MIVNQTTDINLIMERAKRGADLSSVMRSSPPMYGDFTDLPDFRSALLMVNKANAMFMALDARVRERFANDPARLLDFLADDKNRDEAVKLGLFVKKVPVVEKVQKVEVVNPAKPDDTAKPTK